MAVGKLSTFILAALFIATPGLAENYAEQAAALAFKGARGAMDPTTAMVMMNSASQNAKNAAAQKKDEEKPAEKPLTAATPAPTLKLEDTKLPAAITDTSADFLKESSPSSQGGNTGLGGKIADYTEIIANGGKSESATNADRLKADVQRIENEGIRQIINLTKIAAKEKAEFDEQRATREKRKEATAAEEASRPNTMSEKVSELPKSARSVDRELASASQPEDDKMSVKGIKPITE